MSYQRAYALADRLQQQHRNEMAGRRLPNALQTYAMLYEIGLRNGVPVQKITGAIIGAGYVVTKAAASLGSSVYNGVTSQFSNKYTHGQI